MKVKVKANNEKRIANEITKMNETKRALRGVIDDVEFGNRELLEMYAYALYDIHSMYLNGVDFEDIVTLFNSKCAKRITGL